MLAYNGKPEAQHFNQTSNLRNQLVGYSYDIAGNMLNDGLGHSFIYDEENQIKCVANCSTGVTYSYDGDGNRVKKSGGTLYWYGTSSQILKETDLAGNSPKDYIFFNGKRVARRDSATVIHYYFSDHLGSSNVVTNKTGLTIEEESDFYPFGGERVVTDTLANQSYKFTAKERDTESNLDYFGARYYGSNFGRFVTPDWATKPTAVPYAELGNPQTLNLYTYANNNPTTFADLDGHFWFPGVEFRGESGFWWQHCMFCEESGGNSDKDKQDPPVVAGATAGAATAGAGAIEGGLITTAVGVSLAAGAVIVSADYAITNISDAYVGKQHDKQIIDAAIAENAVLLAENTKQKLRVVNGLITAAQIELAKTSAGGPDDPSKNHHKKEVKGILGRAARLAERLPGKLKEQAVQRIKGIQSALDKL